MEAFRGRTQAAAGTCRAVAWGVERTVSGYTLLEVLVGIALVSLVGLAVFGGYVFAARGWFEHQDRLDTQAALREAAARLAREVRLAGACLPRQSPLASLRPLAGADLGEGDELVVRLNPRCAEAVLVAAFPGGSTLQVDRVEGFEPGTQAFLLSKDGDRGQFFRVAAVNAGPPATITVDGSIGDSYPKDSTVYGAEEYRYTIDSSGPEPTLVVATAVDPPAPLVVGIARFDVRYVLDRPFDPNECTAWELVGGRELCVVEEPANDAQWAIVRAVWIDLRARSRRSMAGVGGDGFYRVGELIRVRPRNLIGGE